MKIDKDKLITYLKSIADGYEIDYHNHETELYSRYFRKGMHEMIEYIKYYSEEETLF